MKVITNINSYKLRKEYIQIDEETDFRLESNYIKLNNEYLIEETKSFKDNFHFTNDSNYLLLGTDSKVFKINEGVFLGIKSYDITDNYGIISNKDRFYNLYNFSQNKSILKQWLPNRILHIQDQYWCNDTDDDFKLIDANSGEILWTISQPKVEKPYGYNGLTNIKKVLGIYKGNLWLQLPDSRFLVLDIRDGSIKHELKHDYYIVHERGTYFDKEEGVIKILYYNLYAKYSLDLMDFVEEADLGAPETFQVTSMISRPKDKYIYYTAKLNDVSMISNAYGIFDTEKKKVIFQGEEIEVDGHFYQEPQVNDELFTILDSKGNLIIHKLKDILPKQLD